MLGSCKLFLKVVAGQSQEVKDDQITCKGAVELQQICICVGFPQQIIDFRQLQILSKNVPLLARCRAISFRPA